MDEETRLRRAWFRGYRLGDVELAIARATLAREQAQHELAVTKSRVAAMESEISELHRRVDASRRRDLELTTALDEMRERRDQLERSADAHAKQVVADAEQRSAALRTEGLKQVGALQQQVEELLGLRAGLSSSLKQAVQDVTDSLDRLAAAPARAPEQAQEQAPVQERHEDEEQEEQLPDLRDDVDPRFTRWSGETES
jgi:chromosome segregation ATPase